MKAPKKTIADKSLDILKKMAPTVDFAFAINGIPIPFASLFTSAAEDYVPYNKNMARFYEYVSTQIDLLINKEVLLKDDLLKDEFKSYFIHLINGLTINHQEEKLELFKRLFDNYWCCDINYDLKVIYAELVSKLSVSQIFILRNIIQLDNNMLTDIQTMENLYQNLRINEIQIDIDSFKFLLKDLENRSLIKVSSNLRDKKIVQYSVVLTTEDSNDNKPMIALTDFAKGFINFLNEKK